MLEFLVLDIYLLQERPCAMTRGPRGTIGHDKNHVSYTRSFLMEKQHDMYMNGQLNRHLDSISYRQIISFPFGI